MELRRGIFITSNPQDILEELQNSSGNYELTIIDSGEREFLLEHASLAISKAYISTETVNYIVLVTPKFSIVAQNRLLKILEEPPPNKEFILITKSKASLLPTVKSRLPITILDKIKPQISLDLDISNLTLAKVYQFLQVNSKISSEECKKIVEKIVLETLNSDRYNIDSSTLKLFSNTIRALDIGSSPQFVLSTILLKLLRNFHVD